MSMWSGYWLGGSSRLLVVAYERVYSIMDILTAATGVLLDLGITHNFTILVGMLV